MSLAAGHVYGPVPSRRLGRSLGVDLVPPKTCPYDCIYCQLGATTNRTCLRAEYVPTNDLLADVAQRLANGARCDYLTVAGSGEPTLHRDLGRIIRELKAMDAAPVAVLSNGALLWDPAVSEACAAADVVMPTLAATEQNLFAQIHRPCPEITCEKVLAGLVEFRKHYTGQIWLEVMLLEGINTDEPTIAALRDAIESIRPDRVQVNTAVRPPSMPEARTVPPERMERMRPMLRADAEIVAEYSGPPPSDPEGPNVELVLAMLRRRPCTAEDVAAGLGARRAAVVKLLALLERDGRLLRLTRPTGVFFQAPMEDIR